MNRIKRPCKLFQKKEMRSHPNMLLQSKGIRGVATCFQTLSMIHKMTPAWSVSSMEQGLQSLWDAMDRRVFYRYYTEEEIRLTPDKKDCGLAFFPGEKGTPYVLVVPGGGYSMVCLLSEGYAMVEKFREQGYSVFVLKYRTGGRGLFPGPMEDIQRAVDYITKHAEHFGVKKTGYGVAGFSAGGHLAAMHAVNDDFYNPPGVVFLGYPLLDYENLKHRAILKRCLGKETEHDSLRQQYTPVNHLRQGGPAYFIWHCKEDPICSAQYSITFAQKARELQIPCRLELMDGGVHGLGTGDNSVAEGWVGRALDFWRENSL